MIEIQSNQLVVSFPELPLQPRIDISLQRTLRIPDDGRNYPLPPGLELFPLRHIDDYASKVPAKWLNRGGVLLPMWQSEALWVSFNSSHMSNRDAQYPFAIKIATGKINAVSGEKWRNGLGRNPQDYMVAPGQPWLDGYCVEKGIIRQFVAAPLGEGCSVEEQLTGEAEFGGMQIEVFPMRSEVFEKRFPAIQKHLIEERVILAKELYELCQSPGCREMGLGAGGRMRQEIYQDPFSIHDWDTEHSSRCFLHLVNSSAWLSITGEMPPTRPIPAWQYAAHGMPWFDYYDAELKALEGSATLAKVKSVNEIKKEKRAEPLSDNQSVSINKMVKLKPSRKVRESDFSQ
ncbi:MAG TPA: hypothetical protein VFB72_13740 [Verrucomicrobiae bacterium]|nr:hypothetical protein [Verrucomicrobiae bacterium]